MSQLSNPFIRGYQNLSIGRTLAISTDDDQALIYRTLHESQIRLHDQSFECHRCIKYISHLLSRRFSGSVLGSLALSALRKADVH